VIVQHSKHCMRQAIAFFEKFLMQRFRIFVF